MTQFGPYDADVIRLPSHCIYVPISLTAVDRTASIPVPPTIAQPDSLTRSPLIALQALPFASPFAACDA